jgi:mediator of RNA polymerase II transcription subunit 22
VYHIYFDVLVKNPQKMAEEYRQRLDNNVEKLVENFKGIIKTSKIKDKTNTSREAFQNSVYATTIVRQRHSFVLLIL